MAPPLPRSKRSGGPRPGLLIVAGLAGQTALALRNARLATELSARVELLDSQAEQLAQSRARVIEARDAESIRLQRAIRRDVTSIRTDPAPARRAEQTG